MLNEELLRKSSEFRGALLRRETVRVGHVEASRAAVGDGYDVRGLNWSSCNLQLTDAVLLLMRIIRKGDSSKPVDLTSFDQ